MRRWSGAVAAASGARRDEFLRIGLGLPVRLRLTLLELLVADHVAPGELLRPLERHAQLVVRGEDALDVRIAPRRAQQRLRLRLCADAGEDDDGGDHYSTGEHECAERHRRRSLRIPYIMRTAPLAGKCALITGSVRGLGLAVAQRLATDGCHIVLNGLEPADETRSIASDLQRHGVRSLYCRADLRLPDDIEAMVEDATDAFGAIDILINNAVVRHLGSIEHFGTAEWNEAIAVNLSAAFHTIRLTVPSMKRNGWGR